MRTKTTDMHLHMLGVLLLSEALDLYTIIYIYGHGNVPTGMRYRASTDSTWTVFWFEKNLHGDIVAVYSADGVKQVSYNYNAWGEHFGTIHVSGTKAHKNPFRYRGYYYEISLGLYRTQTRIYDPYSGRFVSPDLFDEWTFSNWQTYVGAAVGGAVGGAILGGTGNVELANVASGFFTTGVGMSLEKVTGVSDKSWAEIGANAVADGIISYGLGKLPGVQKITEGRNNMSAVYRSGLTKLRNGTAAHMSTKVMGKGLVSSFFGSLAMDGYYGVKQFSYNRIRSHLLQYRR